MAALKDPQLFLLYPLSLSFSLISLANYLLGFPLHMLVLQGDDVNSGHRSRVLIYNKASFLLDGFQARLVLSVLFQLL